MTKEARRLLEEKKFWEDCRKTLKKMLIPPRWPDPKKSVRENQLDGIHDVLTPYGVPRPKRKK